MSEFGDNAKLSIFEAGVGYRHEYSPQSTLFAELSAVTSEVDTGEADRELSGVKLSLGSAYSLSDDARLIFGVSHESLDERDSTTIFLDASYRIYKGLHLYTNLTALSDNENFSVGVRYQF